MEILVKYVLQDPITKKWVPFDTHLLFLQDILKNRLKVKDILDPQKHARITDDHPYNEYFFWL